MSDKRIEYQAPETTTVALAPAGILAASVSGVKAETQSYEEM